MKTLVGSDLDRTLIYSRGALDAYGTDGVALVAVERYRDAEASWMCAAAAHELGRLAAATTFVPVTTRTPEQYARIALPGPAPRYAICANGGVLLVDGRPDEAWAADVSRALASSVSVAEVLRHVATSLRPDWGARLREVDGLFCYLVVDWDAPPAGFVEEASAWADARGWQVSAQGRKVYWVPQTLTKSSALAEVARRAGTQRTLAAGDSLLDADLLTAADEAIAARHGELATGGKVPTGVSVTARCGVLAGAEIVDWLLERV